MHIFFFIFLAALAAGMSESLHAAMGPAVRQKVLINTHRFDRLDIYGSSEAGKSALVKRGDSTMMALLDLPDSAARMHSLAKLKESDVYDDLRLAVGRARSIKDLQKVIAASPLWPLMIFDKELFARTCLVVNQDLAVADSGSRKQKLITLRGIVNRWWMPARVIELFEYMGDASLLLDGRMAEGVVWSSDYAPLSNISPFSSVAPARYSHAVVSREVIKNAWYGQVDRQSIPEQSVVVCVDDEFCVEQQCDDGAVVEHEELRAAIVEAAAPEYQSESSLAISASVVRPIRRLQLPGESASPSRFFQNVFDINALARTLTTATSSLSLNVWEGAPICGAQSANVLAPSHSCELIAAPMRNNTQVSALKKNSMAQRLMPPKENILPVLLGYSIDAHKLASWLARSVRSWMPSAASNAGPFYALEASHAINIPVHPLWRSCLSSFWPFLYRKRYHLAFAGAAIGAFGAAYWLSKGAFGACGAASPHPVGDYSLGAHHTR